MNSEQVFIRLNQGVELTAEGEEFFKAIRPLLATVGTLEQKFERKTRTNDTAALVVGGSHDVSANILPKLIMAPEEHHRVSSVHLRDNESRIIENHLLNTGTRSSTHPIRRTRAELVYEPLSNGVGSRFLFPRFHSPAES